MVAIVVFSLGWAFTQNGKDHERITKYMEAKGYVRSDSCKYSKRFNFWSHDSCCEDAAAARSHKTWVHTPGKEMRCFEFVFWKKRDAWKYVARRNTNNHKLRHRAGLSCEYVLDA